MIRDNRVREAVITRGIDGDSVIADIVVIRFDKEEYDSKNGVEIRLPIIDTAERGQPHYQEAKDFTMQFVGQTVQLQIIKKEKYGRVMADVMVMYEGEEQSLGQLLLQKDLAKYYGK